MRWCAVVLSVLAATASAQGAREGDRAFGAAELAAVLSGQTLEFFDASLARYAHDRSYSYRYRPGDPPFVGAWETNADSEVCVVFDNGFSRCDRIVEAGGRLVLITAEGLRFPVRAVRPHP